MPVITPYLQVDTMISRSNLVHSLVTGRKKALAHYIFKDGLELNEGDWVCVPQRAMMGDGTRYRDPRTFDGFRFARANDLLRKGKIPCEVPDRKVSSITESNIHWPIWGFGKTAW